MNSWWLTLFLRKEGYRIYLPSWMFKFMKILLALLVTAVVIYTVNLFMTLETPASKLQASVASTG
jgi:hypothetical protein